MACACLNLGRPRAAGALVVLAVRPRRGAAAGGAETGALPRGRPRKKPKGLLTPADYQCRSGAGDGPSLDAGA